MTGDDTQTMTSRAQSRPSGTKQHRDSRSPEATEVPPSAKEGGVAITGLYRVNGTGEDSWEQNPNKTSRADVRLAQVWLQED